MYLEHYGLSEYPFMITPDSQAIFVSRAYQGALNTLLLALEGGEGFVKVTGEVGTGKSLLCRRLLRILPDSVVTAYFPNPILSPKTLLKALTEELGLKDLSDKDEYHLLQDVNNHLLSLAASGKRVVMCLDEAQAMPLETLETLRLLSNLETEKYKLIQIVLFGQPELNDRLRDRSIRQLLQRIAFHAELDPLCQEELGFYLNHRMRVAGYQGEDLFNSKVIRALYRASGGIPRLVNILTHKSLLSAFSRGKRIVNFDDVRNAAADTEGACNVPWWSL